MVLIRLKCARPQARRSKRQLEERRFKLEAALEDLRNRTSANERLEMQAAAIRGQVEALRELADGRELEVKEQREKLARCAAFFVLFVAVQSTRSCSRGCCCYFLDVFCCRVGFGYSQKGFAQSVEAFMM